MLGRAHEAIAKSCINYLCLNRFDRLLEALQEITGDPIKQSTTYLKDTVLSGDIGNDIDIVIDLSEVPFLRDNESSEALVVDVLKRNYCAYKCVALHCVLHISSSVDAKQNLDLAFTLL